MEYALIIGAYCCSAVLAYLIVKRQKGWRNKVLCDIAFLLISGIIMLLTDIQETTLLIFVLLLAFTLLGILTRVFTPIVLNCVGNLLSKVCKQEYKKQSYEQMFQESHRMFFCALQFTTLKLFLYISLIMSAFNLI